MNKIGKRRMSQAGARLRSHVLLFLALLPPPSLFGHDFWIEPATYRPALNTRLPIRLRLGDHFRGQIVPRNHDHIRRFLIVGPRGAQDMGGVDRMNPAGYVLIEERGLYTVGYLSTASFIELDGGKFESYLAEEGLDSILRLRAERGQSGNAGKESFVRNAKSWICVAASLAKDGDVELGFPFELAAELNPCRLRSSEELPLRLLFEGAPLADALVTAIFKEDPSLRISRRTDAGGRARLRLPRPGIWMMRSVHMIPARAQTSADWESFWASVTFELPE